MPYRHAVRHSVGQQKSDHPHIVSMESFYARLLAVLL